MPARATSTWRGLSRTGSERGVERVETQAWTGTLLTEAFRAIRARVIADTITLPDDETLVLQLGRIRSRTRAGGSAIDVPRSATSHQDSALALANAVLFLERKGVPQRARTWSSFKSRRVVAEDRRTPEPWNPRRNRGSSFGREHKFSQARLSRLYGDAYRSGESREPLT